MRKVIVSSFGFPPQYVALLASFTLWPGSHETYLKGPVPLTVLPIVPALISSLESIAILTPSSAAKIATFGIVKLSVTSRPDASIDLMVKMFARAAALVAGSRIRSRDAFTSSASKVEPSWNLTFLRRCKRSSVPLALNPHD